MSALGTGAPTAFQWGLHNPNQELVFAVMAKMVGLYNVCVYVYIYITVMYIYIVMYIYTYIADIPGLWLQPRLARGARSSPWVSSQGLKQHKLR